MAGSVVERIPPHSDEAERAVLGAILIDPSVINDVRQRIRAEDFYSGANRLIFEAIINIDRQKHKPDLLTLKAELEKIGKLDESGGAGYLADLTNLVPSSANVDYYAQLVQDNSLRRGLIQAAGYAISSAYEETEVAKDILEKTQERLFTLSDTRGLFNYKKVNVSMDQTFKYLEKMHDNKKQYTGIPSGFEDLDKLTLGFQSGEMIVIGARPSMGKTAIALNMAVHSAMKNKIPTAFFSLEMTDRQLMIRILSGSTGIDSYRLRTGFFDSIDMRKIYIAADEIFEAPLFIVDMPRMTIGEIISMSRMLRSKENVEIIFIDYMSIIASNNMSMPRHDFVSLVSRDLKGLARELDIPIVVLSQLNREAEGEKPKMSNIRESGSIEQDADVIMFIHRDREEDKTMDEQAKIVLAQLIVSKNRNGSVGVVKLEFTKHLAKFTPYSEDKK